VIVLTNSTDNPDDIGFHILEPKVELVPPPKPIKQRTEIAVDSVKLMPLVGTYELSPTFRVEITREGAALFAQPTAQPRLALFAESESEFFLKVVDAQISFIRDSAGKVNQIVLHQGGANIPGKRVK
jgi:hypothetical protein